MTTICDKINTVGTALQDNLNDRGVSCTFGGGSGEKNILQLVELVNDTNFKGSSDVVLKVGANRPYLLSGESTDVIVKLENGLCEPQANKSITLGKSVMQDGGTTGNSNLGYWYWNTNYGTGSVGDDGTTFNATTTSYLTASATLTSPSTSSIYIYDFPLVVEFDIVSYNDPSGVTDYSRVRVYNNANNVNCWWDFKNYGVGHYKIVCKDGSQKLYFNGVEQSRSFTFTPTTAWNVSFQTKGNIKYKNFVVYNTMDCVTDEKGEFALYNVSVTDNTIFTVSYGTETATTNVYLCQFVDYGITSNSKLSYWHWNTNYGTGSVSDDGTTFNATTTSYLTASATLTSPSTSSIYIYDFPLTVEFDIVSYNDNTSTTNYSRVRVYNNANNKNAYWNFRDYGVGHYKIVCTEGSQKLYYEGVEQSRSFTFTPTTDWNVALQTYGNIKFHNLAIY